jgi:homotetrameric cytidine deaminase
MSSVNLELKARDPDPESTAARCVDLGAEDHGVLRQADTYFMARRGRLKLREGGDGTELIAYRRPDDAEPRESTYVRAPVADAAPVIEALDAALGTTVVVSKRRRLFLWEGVRIHLDEVDGLGSFIEFEAVLPDAGDLAAAHEKVARLKESLDVADESLVSRGYADLLLDGPQALLRAADAAMRNAYAPYSEFKVGAAVRAPSGAIYAGANVENVAYPQGQCAEASALGALVAAGETAITAVAVVAERLEVCPPCGGCRQRLSEFGDASTPVYLGPTTTTLGELLPGAFDRQALA